MKIDIINKSNNPLPKYATELSAGCDLSANEDTIIKANESAVISTGIYAAIPKGFYGAVKGRSGLNFKFGIIVPDGTIDADYRGEIKVKAYNLSNADFAVVKGERIAQLIIEPFVQAYWNEVSELDATDRGEGGFGSTGRV